MNTAPVPNTPISHIVHESVNSAIMSSKQTTTNTQSGKNTKGLPQVEKPERGAPRQNSEDCFQATDGYDDYDDFEIGTGGGGGSKTNKRENNRGHSGSQGPYSAKHNRLRAERPKTYTAPK
jgi:hypothetical protein